MVAMPCQSGRNLSDPEARVKCRTRIQKLHLLFCRGVMWRLRNASVSCREPRPWTQAIAQQNSASRHIDSTEDKIVQRRLLRWGLAYRTKAGSFTERREHHLGHGGTRTRARTRQATFQALEPEQTQEKTKGYVCRM